MKKRVFKYTSQLAYRILDFCVVAISILAAYKIYRLMGIGKQVVYENIDILPASFLIALATVIIAQLFGTYKQESSVLNAAEIRDVIKSVTVTFLITMVVLVFGKYVISRYVLLISYILTILALIAVKTVTYHISQSYQTKSGTEYQKKILIYGAGELGQMLYRELANSPRLNIVPLGFIDDDSTKIHQTFFQSGVNTMNGLTVLGDRDDLKRLMKELHIDEVFVAISNISPLNLMQILDFLRNDQINFNFVPNLCSVFVHKLKLIQIGQIPLIQETEFKIQSPYIYFKRYFDFVLALIMVILLFPLFLIISVMIKVDSKGPVIFTQKRVGKDGLVFNLYKFRSMFRDAEQYAINPLDPSDPRITRIGKFIRKLSLDELPQIINVLKGEMSFVGPRPEMPFIVAEYNNIQKERLKVLPGITGLWQLSGDRRRAIHENMDYDLYYIRNMSFFLDMAILIETFIFAFRGI